jgi:hypothetical protein
MPVDLFALIIFEISFFHFLPRSTSDQDPLTYTSPIAGEYKYGPTGLQRINIYKHPPTTMHCIMHTGYSGEPLDISAFVELRI